MPDRGTTARLRAALEEIGWADADRRFLSFSAGMRRRWHSAAECSAIPRLLDEPHAALDVMAGLVDRCWRCVTPVTVLGPPPGGVSLVATVGADDGGLLLETGGTG